MIGRQDMLWFGLGFALSAVVAAVFGAVPARAQSRFDTTIQRAPQPVTTPQRPRRGERPRVEEEEQPLYVQRPIRTDGPQDGDAEPDPAQPAAEPRQPPPQQRTQVPQDGDLSFPLQAEPLQGGMPVDPPLPDETNADPGQVDARFREDVDAFERPPAGYDAIAFQIEDIDPILDQRPQRLFRFEPYDPIGVRRGSFIVLPELQINGFATNNLSGAGPRRGAAALEVRPGVRAVSDWRAHALEVRASGLASFFSETSRDNDREYLFETRGRVDLAKRTNIEMLASAALTQDGRTSRDAVGGAIERTDIHTNRAAAAFNHRFNRLSVQLRGSFSDVDYDGVRTSTGGFVTNAERDYRSIESAARATWQFKPSLAAFAEAGTVTRDFHTPASDGIARDSTGERYRAGLSFGTTSQKLRGEVSIGWGQQRPDDARLGSVSGLLIDANLGYRMSALTSFLLTARTDFVESFSPNASGGTEHTFGLETRHAFMRHLIGTAAARHKMTDFEGGGPKERELINELSLEYFFNRDVTIFGRYTHTNFDSSAPGGDYTSDAIRIGMRIRH